MAINILAMDGGGVLTLFSLWMIQTIQGKRQDFLSSVDIFAGTSAGGINALFMTASASREEGLRRAIDLWCEDPFSSSLGRTVASLAGCVSFYGNEGLQDAVRPVLGDVTLGDLAQKGEFVVIPVFQLEGKGKEGQRNWKPKVFHNFGGSDEPDLYRQAFDVAIGTSSTPVSLPIYQGMVDGGLYANNPSMCALAQVLSTPLDGDGEAAVEPADVRLLSVGTGQESAFLRAKNAPWGWRQWLFSEQRPLALLEACFESGSLAIDFMAGSILGKRFHRLNPLLHGKDVNFDLEDAYAGRDDVNFKKIKELFEKLTCEGEGDCPWLDDVLAWLEEIGWSEKPSSG